MDHLQLSTRRLGRAAVVTVGGELDSVTKGALDRCLRTFFRTADDHVVVDLSGVTFMDSGALGMITEHHQRATSSEGSLAFAGASPSRMQVLWLTGLATWLPFYKDVAAAVQALGGDDGPG
ncbi:anti-sigma B factor antagonist [Nonomuraea solani]|uniref:Anti-sigma factor antagonist n=1 Tax=Nonomuraea solani TaxID=1144553 RepID=A0A1H6EWG1_9ACTN|nr:STAS domain-containing protein [Nonomuraea solani]SEH01209.1 anti-sigma B factor antagonist [Nonomuraea solani]